MIYPLDILKCFFLVLPSHVSLLPMQVILSWTLPLRSVWSHPQRLGTDSLHFLWTFISQAEKIKTFLRFINLIRSEHLRNTIRFQYLIIPGFEIHTVTFQALVYKTIKKRSTVVTKRWASICMRFKSMMRPIVLKK